MQSLQRHAGQYPVFLCNVLLLASVTPAALLHQVHSPVRMDEIATFSRWKAVFAFFLTRKKNDPSRVERAKKKREK